MSDTNKEFDPLTRNQINWLYESIIRTVERLNEIHRKETTTQQSIDSKDVQYLLDGLEYFISVMKIDLAQRRLLGGDASD